MKNLKITSIQTFLYWEDAAANISHFESRISSVKEESDLIVLPEMFTTGFTMNPEKFAEEQEGPGLQMMKSMAAKMNRVICGSIAVKDKDKFYNRLYWVRADGSFAVYNKRHLFRMAGEEKHYTPGNEKVIVELNGWKINLQVCYDLRFPTWSRNKWDAEKNFAAAYDVLLYVANWPEVRNFPWKQLLIARAIENQSFVVGVNRVGTDGNNFSHSGDSVVLNPRGEQLSKTKAHEDAIETVELNMAYLEEFRKIFPVGMDAD
ncbi:MAG: amidohydrolase [Bacteroidia bacterium]|nr:amidohydrolase [Bacteroidia bacterium]